MLPGVSVLHFTGPSEEDRQSEDLQESKNKPATSQCSDSRDGEEKIGRPASDGKLKGRNSSTFSEGLYRASSLLTNPDPGKNCK